jgi:hypothetical protein
MESAFVFFASLTTGEWFGYLAALVWLTAALIKLPSNIWFQSHLGGGGTNEQFELLVWRLKVMSWLNAIAAALTGISVFFLVRGR